MNSSIFIDPRINLDSEENVEVIIQFKTKPAKIQVKIMPNKTLEKATELVEESHQKFQQDLVNYLDKNQIEYTILNRYKAAFNGVAMKLNGKDIRQILQSNEIAAIYINETITIPPQPNDPRYQI